MRKRALSVYFVLLLLVYAIFVFFGGAIVAGFEIGVGSATNAAGGGAAQPLALPGAAVPFAVSLAMVGIAPRIELLDEGRGKDPCGGARDDGPAPRPAVVGP